MNSHKVAQSRQPLRIFSVLPKVLAGVVVLLLGLVGLAVWPHTMPLGRKGDKSDGQKVANALRVMETAKAGRVLGREFLEQDLNAYLEFFKAEDLGFKSISIAAMPGYFRVRFIKAARPLRPAGLTVEPKISYDLVCVPIGGRVMVRTVSIGHLRCVGPAKTMTVRRLMTLLRQCPEWATLARTEEIKSEQGKLWLSVKGK